MGILSCHSATISCQPVGVEARGWAAGVTFCAVNPQSTSALDPRGLANGVSAYLLWGVLPLYFTLLVPAGPAEVIAHRVLWSLLFCAVVLTVGRAWGAFATVFRSGRTIGVLGVAAVLLAVNWLTFVYGTLSGHVVDAALGYFINPLLSVALGMVIFGERLNRAQLVALVIAVIAVSILAIEVGAPPWIALGLALSFGLYGAVKKVVPVDPRVSVGIESALAAPFALGYMAVIQLTGQATFTDHGLGHTALMILSGIVTAVPLLFFAAAAHRLPLVTLGLLMYLTPVMQMTWGVVVGHEPMPVARWLGFGLIWVALGVFTSDALLRSSTR